MDTWILMNYHRPNTPTNLGQRNQQKVEKSGQIMLEETHTAKFPNISMVNPEYYIYGFV